MIAPGYARKQLTFHGQVDRLMTFSMLAEI
jgi:hypothetical protein